MSSKLELLATHLEMGQKATSQLVRDLHARTGTVWSHEALYTILLPHPGPFSFEQVLALVADHADVTSLAKQLALAPESIPIMLERLRTKLGFPVLRGDVVAACALLGETARDQNELRAFLGLIHGATKTPDARSAFATAIQALRSTLSPPPSYQELAAVWQAMPPTGPSPRIEHFKDYLLVDAAVRQSGIAGGGVRYLERVWLPQARDLTLDELAAIVAQHHTLDQPGIQAVIRGTRFARKNATTLEDLLDMAQRAFRRPAMTVPELAEILDLLTGSWETLDDLVAYSALIQTLQQAQLDTHMAATLVKGLKFQLPAHRSLATLREYVQTALMTMPAGASGTVPLLIKATLKAIRTEDSLQQIAQCLGTDLAATREIVTRIQRSMQPPMSLRHIATFIAALPAHQQTATHVLQYFDDYATETALAAHFTAAERDRIAAALRTSTPQRIESIDILRAIKHVLDSPKAERVDEAIAYLRIQHQGHTVTHPEVLRASLRKQLPHGTFRDVSRHLELLPAHESRGRSIEGLYAERCLALCLSQALPLTLAESQALIRQVQDIPGRNVALPQLLEAINQLPEAERRGETLLAYLTIESWIVRQHWSGYTPARLRRELTPRQQEPLSYPTIARMLVQLPAASLSISDLAPYARLAAWMADPAATHTTINRQLPNAITYDAMADFWQHTPAPPMTTHNDAIALFRMLPAALREQPWVQRTDAELWATTHAVTALVAPRWRSLSAAGMAAATHAAHQDWRAITSEERLYAIPTRGYAEIQVDPDVLRRTGITALRFIQEHSTAPAVRLRVTLGTPALVAWIALDRHGETTGFHQQLGDPSYAAFVHTLAVAYYRDLVVPTTPTLSIPDPWPMVQQRSRPISPGPTRTRHVESAARTLPRQRTEDRQRADLAEWHHAQERARHGVVGHARWIGAGFRADLEKVREAAQAGVQLMAGYTWVREHERGSIQQYGRISLDGDALVYPMLFTPPTRATRLLQALV